MPKYIITSQKLDQYSKILTTKSKGKKIKKGLSCLSGVKNNHQLAVTRLQENEIVKYIDVVSISAFGIMLNYWYSLLLVTVTSDTIKSVR